MSRLELSFFGPPRLERNGQPVGISRRKGTAMLAYLAVTAKPHSRDTLATMFWPDVSQSRARGNLRRLLSDLNREIGDGLLTREGENVFLNVGEDLWVDVVRFRDILGSRVEHGHLPDETCPDCIPLLEEAAALYSADFLAGFTLRDTLEFDDWQYFETAGLREELAKVLERLASGLRARGEYEAAIPHVRRWLAIDPLHEPSQLMLMELYHQAGQSSAALRQYELYVELLKDELGASPGAEMRSVYEEIKLRRTSRGDENPVHTLPVQATSFVGREKELADITQLLQADPECRLITLVGPGGIGKTRLALEAAAQAKEAFRDGVVFVSLAPVNDPAFIVTAIAEAIKFNFQGEAKPKKQLLFYLSQKNYLLILDNFEQLLFVSESSTKRVHEGEELLSEILQAAPHIKLLVTSRERLNVQEEWGYDVPGMPFPEGASDHDADAQDLEHFAAVQLFLQRARKASARFDPSIKDMQAVIRICRLVGGTPLGIELAAPWVRSISCQEIAEEIERSYDLLVTSVRNVPERHRSVRAIMEQTWQHLSADEQSTLCKLSVFRGGCQREAAEAVTGTNLKLLSSLVDKALLHRTGSGRYELHELIRQFAFERLQSNPEMYTQTLNLHYSYYTEFLEGQAEGLKGGPQLETARIITAEIDNIRAAWQRAIEVRDYIALEQASECFYLYSELRSALAEGESAFRRAAVLFELDEDRSPSTENSLRGYLLVAQGSLCAHSGDLQGAQYLLEKGLAFLDPDDKEISHKEKRAFALMQLGRLLFMQANNTFVEQTIQDSINIYTEIDEGWGIAKNLSILGNSLTGSGRLAEAESPLRRSLAICQDIGDRRSCVLINWNLAILTFWFGEYDQTQQFLTEAAALAREFDDQTGLALTLKELGKLEVARGHYRQAIGTFHESIQITDKIGSQWESAATSDDLGVALCLAGDYAAAENALRRCLAASQTRQHRYFIARCLGDLGLLAYYKENFQLAEQQLQEALAIWTDLGHEPYSAWVLCQLGHVLQATGQEYYEKSGQTYKHALQLSLKHGLEPIIMDIHTGEANLLQKAGKLQKAIKLLSMVANHPASTYETREKAHKFSKGTNTDTSAKSSTQTGQVPDRKAANSEQPDDERRLAAIMFTDMVGFTTLAQWNEALAMQLLDEQREIIRHLLAKYRGREVETTGDGFLVEFASSLGAVRCAVEIQSVLKQLNEVRPEGERILIRIGIHLGDVIHKGKDVAGDAVNVASRIESLAPSGGVCVTAQVYASVLNKVEYKFVSLGNPELKNVATPIEVFLVSGYGQSVNIPPQIKAALPTDRVAVLPFTNISHDPADEYFADGITEEIISSVSKTRGLRVIARTSVMRYKGASKAIAEIGRELNVGSILEGSVRKAGDKIRISVQFVETTNEEPRWSQVYDREISDVFAIQSEIARKVAEALRAHVLGGAPRREERKATSSPEAYINYLRGRQFWNKRTDEDLRKSIEFFEAALKLDPNYAQAYTGLADSYAALALLEFMAPNEAYPKAKEAVRSALSLDAHLADAHTSLGLIRFQYDWDWKQAEEEFRTALDINPSYAPAHHFYADYLKAMGRFDEALLEIEKARELDPLSLAINIGVGHVLYLSRQYDKAIEEYLRAVELDPSFMATHVWFGRPYLEKGLYAEAIAELETAVRLSGESTLALAMLGHGLASAGHTDDALQILEKLKERSKSQYVPSYWIAVIYNGFKDKEKTVAWMWKAFEERSSWLVWSDVEPRFEWLRGDPDFDALMKAMKFP